MARSADARAKRAAIARAEAAKTRETIRQQGGVKGHGINGVLTSKDRRVLRRKAAREGAADGGAAAPADDALAPADDASAPARAPDPAAGKKMELTAKERRRLKRAAERADGGAPETAAAPSEPPPITAKERRRLKRAAERATGGDAPETDATEASASAAPSEPRLTAKERRRLKRAGKGDAWEAAKKARTS